MNYRTARVEDLSQLAELRWDFRMESGDEIPVVSKSEFIDSCTSFLKYRLENKSYVGWIAEDDGEIVAHIFVHKIDLVPRPCKIHDQFGYITNNYTKPEYRRKGIGSQLMAKVLDWAKDEDLELLIVYPSEQAVSYYSAAGFHPDSEIMEFRLREY